MSQKVIFSREKLNIRGVQSLTTPGITPGRWFESQTNRRELMLAAWNLVDVEWPSNAVPNIVGANIVRISSESDTHSNKTGFRRGQYILAKCPQGHIAQMHIMRGIITCGTCTLRRQMIPIYGALTEIFGEIWFCHRDAAISPPLRLMITAGVPSCRKISSGGFEFLHISVRRAKLRHYLIAALSMYPRAGIGINIVLDAVPLRPDLTVGDGSTGQSSGQTSGQSSGRIQITTPTEEIAYEDCISEHDLGFINKINN